LEIKGDGPLQPGAKGPVVFIDGVQVSGGNSTLAVQQGKLAGQLAIRDEMSLTYEAQLDELARSLINTFAEEDQSLNGVLPAATGLFKYGGSPTVPADPSVLHGLAGSIDLDPQFDALAGGNPMLIRDGGKNGAPYKYNMLGVSGFQQRLNFLGVSFDKPFNFDPTAELGRATSIKSFSEISASGVEIARATASRKFDESQASHQRWSETLLSKSGVNLDQEMSTLLSLEKSYQASAKVLSTIDQMFSVLVGIVN
jgi:flagellar hook-associated protein 1